MTPLARSLALALGLLFATPVAAAPLESPHFRFYAAPGTEQATARLAAEAEARFEHLCRMIDACESLGGPVEVWLSEDADGFARHFREGSPMAEWAVGVAFPDVRRVVLRAHGSALFSLQETFDHELSHVLVHARTKGRVPRWLTEGVAIWQAGEAVLDRLVDAQRAAVAGNLVPIAELGRRFPVRGPSVGLAYAESALFVHWLEKEYGSPSLPRLLARLGEGLEASEAFEATFGLPIAELEALWQEDVSRGSAVATLLGNPDLLWGLMSLLFLVAAWAKLRARRRQLAALGEREAREDVPFYDAGPVPDLDPDPRRPDGPTFH